MTTKHTPGLWAVTKAKHGVDMGHYFVALVAPDRNDRALVVHAERGDDVQGDANANLIAAAPELYHALDDLFTDMIIAQGNMRDAAKRDTRWEGCAEEIQPRIDAARAALAKARGSQ